ncbi:branchpoint-bridging protein-like [Rattus rattus]|uniref:branchpoint-bridging protein-like n=1 Tax=Rattus rattus TaxID=10117 RepID=UPI0013F33E4B|nr:branchpoint-bridging protein-like [Rattus rattus]
MLRKKKKSYAVPIPGVEPGPPGRPRGRCPTGGHEPGRARGRGGGEERADAPLESSEAKPSAPCAPGTGGCAFLSQPSGAASTAPWGRGRGGDTARADWAVEAAVGRPRKRRSGDAEAGRSWLSPPADISERARRLRTEQPRSCESGRVGLASRGARERPPPPAPPLAPGRPTCQAGSLGERGRPFGLSPGLGCRPRPPAGSGGLGDAAAAEVLWLFPASRPQNK